MMNGAIRAREVRLIGAEGEQLGVTPTSEALMQAENLNMDLVLISNQEPPVAKIMDYTKFMFEQKKKQKEAKKKQAVVSVKEVRLSPVIDQNDFDTKLRQRSLLKQLLILIYAYKPIAHYQSVHFLFYRRNTA